MSFKLMAKAIDLEVGNSTRKLVLLKLADQANDDGFCFPSIATIRKACEIKSDNTVRSHIQELVKQGLVRVEKRWNSEKQCNYSNSYYLTLDGNQKNLGTSNIEVPPSNNEVGGTSNNEGGTSNIEPEPINEPTNIEPITEPKKNNTKKSKKFEPKKPDSVSDQVWLDLLAHRKASGVKLETETAWRRIFNQLDIAKDQTGHTLDEIIGFWISKGWKGFTTASWYTKDHVNTEKKQLKLSNKQRAFFGRKLAELPAVSHRAKGRDAKTSFEAFGKQIALELKDDKKFNYYRKYLVELGLIEEEVNV